MVCFIKNKSFALLCLIALMCSCKKEQIGATISEVISPATSTLYSVKFIGQIGFACGGLDYRKGELLKTTDGGESWNLVALPESNGERAIYGLDVLADGTFEAVGYGGQTFRSDDFASTIVFNQDPRWKLWRSICFRTPNSAVLCGQDGLDVGYISSIHRSSNWSYPFFQNEHSFSMYHITFADSNTGYISGFGAIYKTTDGGSTWDFTAAKNDYFTATTWFSSNEGVAIGWEGSVLRTANGGADWEQIRSANKLGQKKIRLKSLAQNSRQELIAAGEKGCMLFSTDKGKSWKFLEDAADVNFESISFLDDDHFFAVGSEGRIFKVEL